MNKKQLVVLLACNVVPFAAGNGMFALMPVYVSRLGGDAVAAGYNLSVSYIAIALGLFLGGWLSDRTRHRAQFIMICGIVVVPTIWLIGQVKDVWQLTALTATLMFFYGIILALTGLLTGLLAQVHERGRVFGIIGSAPAIGSLIGGAVGGPIVDRWGFSMFFSVLAVWSILLPLLALLLQDKVIVHTQPAESTGMVTGQELGHPFMLLMLATLLAGVASAGTILGQPLLMDQRGFNATAISSTQVVSGLIILPLPLLAGWLSDRTGRKLVLAVCFLACAVGIVLLSRAVDLWQFWLASGLLGFLTSSRAVGSAMTADMVPHDTLGTGISVSNAIPWVANVIGTAAAGSLFQRWGTSTTFTLSAMLPLLAIVVLVIIRQSVTQPEKLKLA